MRRGWLLFIPDNHTPEDACTGHRRGIARTHLVILAMAGAITGVFAPGCSTTPFVSGPKFSMEVREWSQEGLVGREITTDHYTIFSTLHDPELEEALPGFLETVFERYEKTFSAPADEPIKLTTYVFGTRQEWERFVRRHYSRGFNVYRRIRSGGFSRGNVSVSFYTSRSATLSILAHEGWHQYLAVRFKGAVPAWLNEGLACYHETVSFAGKKPTFTPRHNTFRINSLRDALQRDELLPLSQIVDTDAGKIISQNHSVVTQTYYSQAWALVTFLRHGQHGRHARGFDRLLADLDDGTFHTRISARRLSGETSKPASFGELVFVHYFKMTPDELAEDYYNHLVRISGF